MAAAAVPDVDLYTDDEAYAEFERVKKEREILKR